MAKLTINVAQRMFNERPDNNTVLDAYFVSLYPIDVFLTVLERVAENSEYKFDIVKVKKILSSKYEGYDEYYTIILKSNLLGKADMISVLITLFSVSEAIAKGFDVLELK